MMQQVATQRSEIAALPIDIDTSAGVSTSDGQQQAFADVFNRAATPAEQARKSSSASQRPDNTTDAKSVDNKRSVSSRDSQTSREPMERNKNHVADEHKVNRHKLRQNNLLKKRQTLRKVMHLKTVTQMPQ